MLEHIRRYHLTLFIVAMVFAVIGVGMITYCEQAMLVLMGVYIVLFGLVPYVVGLVYVIIKLAVYKDWAYY